MRSIAPLTILQVSLFPAKVAQQELQVVQEV
jgi:hypothetical protein